MSFYSIIDDYLIIPNETPIIFLTLRNWPSFAVLVYMLFLFVFGVVYSYNKDSQDFKILHE
jgi:hypothetical protein